MSEEQLIKTPGVFGETGNFLLEREMGRGGMGGVYMGRDKMLDRPVAVKVMLKEYGADAEFVEKFKREAQAAARLIHPNIAQVYSYGIADGMPYIAMELVAGGSLDKLMQNAGAAIDIPRVMKIGEQVAQALRCAADQGLVHGDVKPENVLLDANGNAKLVDFGLAGMQKDTNEIWGTPYYIAPEKVKKEPVDFRADMYSLGGTLYHALTGVAPFEGDDMAAVVRKRFEGAPVAPSKIRSDITPQIDALILKMLALNPSDRYPSFEALLEAFKAVMARGLTATPGGNMPTGVLPNGRRIMLSKRFKMKEQLSEDAQSEADKGEGGEGEAENEAENEAAAEAEGGKKRRFTKRHATKMNKRETAEEESGGVAGKVAAVIGITIGAIALVAGLLVWYVIADRNARARAEQEQISREIHRARESIADTRRNAVKFADEFDALAAKAVAECQKPTDQLRRELSGQFDASVLARIKPDITDELRMAIALTNVSAQAESGDTNAIAAAAAPIAQAMAGAMQQAMKEMASGLGAAVSAVAQMPQFKFRPPNDDEADPASPEHEKYEKEKAEAKAKFEAEWKEKAAAAATAATTAAAEPAATSSSEGGSTSSEDAAVTEALNIAIRDMNDLWGRAYSCQAAAIILHDAITKLIAKIDSAKIEGEDRATMDTAAQYSRQFQEEFEQIKASEEVSKVQKAVGFIRSKGTKTVKQTMDRLLIAAKEKERKEEAERKKKEEEERQARLAKEKEETIARDNEKVKEKFASLAESGVFRQLNWTGAIRQLQALRDEFKYADSQLVADGNILKVKMMATVQEVFIANCKGYVFAKSKLARYKIADISEKEISLVKPDGKTPMKMTWVKFYQQYHGNLNELIVKFIEKGKDTCKLKDGKRLSLQPWAEAMMGAALTMQIICSDDPAAATRAEQIAKNAVKAYPDYLKHAQEIFPDITFDATPEE